MARRPAPLSPHLAIYRPLHGSFTSIAQRATNTALFAGTWFFAAWLVAIAAGGRWFDLYTAFWASWLGQVMLFGWSFAALFSAAQWLRHFAWDVGYGFELRTSRITAILALVGAAVATLGLWTYIGLRGGA
jgi:succinate dehydrogenase / fumarate reductase, cytochrome b subunit